MSARDSVDTLFHSKTSLCSVSLTTRPRRHWGLKSAKGDSRSLRSRESPPNLNIKGTSWTSVKTWITAGGPLVQVGSAPVHLVPSKKLDRPSSIHWGLPLPLRRSPRDVSIPRGPASRSREKTSSLPRRDMTSLAWRNESAVVHDFKTRSTIDGYSFLCERRKEAYSLKTISWNNSKYF